MFGPPVKIEKNKSFYADLVLLGCAVIWGGNYPITKIALTFISPLFMNGFKFLAAFILMAVLFPRRTIGLRLPDLIPGLFLGVSMFAAYSFHTIGLKYTMAGTAAFLTATYVVFVPFIMWFIEKKFSGFDTIVSSALCIAGVYLLTGTGGQGFGKGELLTVLSAACFAVNIVSAGYFAKRTDPIKMTLMETGVSAVLFIASALIFEPISIDVNRSSILSLAYLIIPGTLGTHLVSNYAMRFTPETHASITFSLEAVFALILGAVFLKEQFTLLMIVGCVIIFGSVLTTELEPVNRFRVRPGRRRKDYRETRAGAGRGGSDG